jgi:hypothetical protein
MMTKEQEALAQKYAGYWMTKVDEDYPVPFNAESFNPAVYELIPPGQRQPEAKQEPVVRKASKPKAKSAPLPALEGEAIEIKDAPIGGLDVSEFGFSDEDL